MSRSTCCREGNGRCEKPENSQEVSFLRLKPQMALKEADTNETGDLCFYIHRENMNIFYKGGDGSIEHIASNNYCKMIALGRGRSSFIIQGSGCRTGCWSTLKAWTERKLISAKDGY